MHLLDSLRDDVFGDVSVVVLGVEFERLAEALVVSAVPAEEALAPEQFLLLLLVVREDDLLDALQTRRVLGVEFLLEQLLQSLGLGEEPVVLHLEQLLLLRLARHAHRAALEELRKQLALAQIQSRHLLLASADSHLFIQHVHYMLL